MSFFGEVFAGAATGGAAEVLKKAILGPTKKAPEAAKPDDASSSTGIFEWLKQKVGIGDKAREIHETAKKERSQIFGGEKNPENGEKKGGVWAGIMARYYPSLSKLGDLRNPLESIKKIKENPMNLIDELDGLCADTILIPDFLLKFVTDPLVETDVFKKLVDFYDKGFAGLLTPNIPLLHRIPVLGPEKQNWSEKIFGKGKNYDPDDVFSFLRIILKDKDTLKEVVSKFI